MDTGGGAAGNGHSRGPGRRAVGIGSDGKRDGTK
jgi:hypothetical protein